MADYRYAPCSLFAFTLPTGHRLRHTPCGRRPWHNGLYSSLSRSPLSLQAAGVLQRHAQWQLHAAASSMDRALREAAQAHTDSLQALQQQHSQQLADVRADLLALQALAVGKVRSVRC